MVFKASYSGLALSVLSLAAVAQAQPPATDTSAVTAASPRNASQRCRAHASVNSCDDAIRWNPSDPTLLVAMGDMLMHARRPADAARAYQRAAALAPNMPGIAAKIATAQTSAKLKVKGAAGDASDSIIVGKRFSNSDPDTQTH